jgi:hypothetical protein
VTSIGLAEVSESEVQVSAGSVQQQRPVFDVSVAGRTRPRRAYRAAVNQDLKEKVHMKLFTKWFIIVCVFAVCLVVLPSASADDTNNLTKVTFSRPFEVPGVGAQVLPAGTYWFKLVDSLTDRHIVQIFNEKQDHIFTTILAIPNYRARATGKTVMTFKERAEGEPQALRTWFYPGRRLGEEFVYPKEKALELAKIVNEPVLFTPVTVATIDDLKTVPVLALKPTGEEIPVAEVVHTTPVEDAKLEAKMEEPKTLPATASYLPLLACVGLLSLGAAGVISKHSA